MMAPKHPEYPLLKGRENLEHKIILLPGKAETLFWPIRGYNPYLVDEGGIRNFRVANVGNTHFRLEKFILLKFFWKTAIRRRYNVASVSLRTGKQKVLGQHTQTDVKKSEGTDMLITGGAK